MERLEQSYFEKYEIQTKAMFLMTLQKSRGENTSAQKLEKLSMPPSPNKLFYICTLLASWAGEGNGTPLQYSCLENPMDRRESDMTERLHFHFPLSCTGEGNGNPLQCSCLENPRDGGAWWAVSMGSHRVGHD